jgi:DNA end-binding protein Ku
MKSIWTGTISFGLINIPVSMYSASRSRELKFKMLHKSDMGEISYTRICKADGKEVPWEDIAKGFEYKSGDVVVLSEEDFISANPKKTRTVEIVDFTHESQIDTMYYSTPYYLEPQKGAEKAYALLRDALKRSKKVAVGQFVFKHHEHIGVIRPHGDLLILNQLRYDSELIEPQGLNIPKKSEASKSEVDIAVKFIGQQTKPFKPSEYHDTYTEELKEIIRKKHKGKKIAVQKGEEPRSPKVHDIMALLKASLVKQQKKKPKKRKAA